MTYYVILVKCESELFAGVCDDKGTVTSDELLHRARRIAEAKFGHFIAGKLYTLDLLAAHDPPVIRANFTGTAQL
ncbi:MAG: hypothetical protein IPK44_01305 [Candidatus Accumulibacter sp.]|uniref:hypothetical protein n=1 Tax=Accumulibacter sp. TaxID=2053492 RepID=UPI0025840EE7|nr:hypothetical protein [Accumulibacter sp.]MBK8113236.1 hypothetical protein [Accumulibacter sp.]